MATQAVQASLTDVPHYRGEKALKANQKASRLKPPLPPLRSSSLLPESERLTWEAANKVPISLALALPFNPENLM